MKSVPIRTRSWTARAASSQARAPRNASFGATACSGSNETLWPSWVERVSGISAGKVHFFHAVGPTT